MSGIISTDRGYTVPKEYAIQRAMFGERHATIQTLHFYTAILQTVLYMKRYCFAPDNVHHLKHYIVNTQAVIHKLRKDVVSTNALVVFDEYDRLISFLTNSENVRLERVPKIVNFEMLKSIISSDNRYSARALLCILFPLVLAGQTPKGRYELELPRVFFETCDSQFGIPLLRCYGSGEFTLDTDNMRFVDIDTLWYNVFSVYVESEYEITRTVTLKRVDEQLKNIRTLHIPVYPSRHSQIGITCYDCTSVNVSLKDACDISLSEELRVTLYGADREEAANVQCSTEAKKDELDLEEEPDDLDTGDDADDLGESDDPDKDITDLDEDNDFDNPGEDEGEISSDEPEENNADSDSASSDDEASKERLAKSIYVLAKDEILDDLVYKLTVANYIDNIDRDEIDAETLSSLLVWKNMFLFILSAESTKKFMKSIKHPV